MLRLYRTSLVLAILVLVILGLNTSTQGMNSLTLNNQKPVLGFETDDDEVNVFTLGESHSYNKQQVVRNINSTVQRVQIYAHSSSEYVVRKVKVLKEWLLETGCQTSTK
ncbi:MAG: hypothetical protein PHQ94_01900 [Syntrophomonas sp.]|jgi:predicted HTH transcriptional regulator|nr:hypothetical protein [Syntrophomonas sp.]